MKIACPMCKRKLEVTERQIRKDVVCPCGIAFTLDAQMYRAAANRRMLVAVTIAGSVVVMVALAVVFLFAPAKKPTAAAPETGGAFPAPATVKIHTDSAAGSQTPAVPAPQPARPSSGNPEVAPLKTGDFHAVSATASNIHSAPYDTKYAIDGNPNTRWASGDGVRSCWIELDLGEVRTFDHLLIDESCGRRIQEFHLAREENGKWITFFSGGQAGPMFTASFPNVATRRVRLEITRSNNSPTITEILPGLGKK